MNVPSGSTVRSSHPGPGSRYFAVTEMDTDVEGEDSDTLVLEAPPAGTERSGVRRLVVLGAQTQVDPVGPTALDEDSEEGSDHHSPDTESVDSLRAKSRSCHLRSRPFQLLPSPLRGLSAASSGWREWIWKLFSNSVRV